MGSITVNNIFFLPLLFSTYNRTALLDYLDHEKFAQAHEKCLNAESKESTYT